MAVWLGSETTKKVIILKRLLENYEVKRR